MAGPVIGQAQNAGSGPPVASIVRNGTLTFTPFNITVFQGNIVGQSVTVKMGSILDTYRFMINTTNVAASNAVGSMSEGALSLYGSRQFELQYEPFISTVSQQKNVINFSESQGTSSGFTGFGYPPIGFSQGNSAVTVFNNATTSIGVRLGSIGDVVNTVQGIPLPQCDSVIFTVIAGKYWDQEIDLSAPGGGFTGEVFGSQFASTVPGAHASCEILLGAVFSYGTNTT